MPTNFVFCLHNHQPVDNFDPVFVQAFDDAYLPFLERIEKRAKIKFVAHYSGPLLEWLDKNRPEFLDRLKRLVEAGRLELMGGGFFEPVFTMLPDADAAGQLAIMSEFLAKRFERHPEGAWLPERVWEQSLVPVLARSGVKYTVLDDFHFRAAGVAPADLDGAYLTEDRGEILRVFPLHEELRYAIPYKDPAWTIDYLQRFSDDAGRRTVVYADDGEKFGLWPNTKRHVYGEGWLDRLFDALEAASDRVRTVTFSEALAADRTPRRIYFPSTSYREMGEWSLPPAAQAESEALTEELKRQGRFDAAKPFLLGGTWRGFKAKYPEANLMYGRMLHVSKKARASGRREALEELYRGQCNCGYWHGVFGGLHLPHLRGSVYRHLIAAERIIEGAKSGAEMLDIDLDGREDFRLYNPKLNAFVTPAIGGHVVELDVRDAGVNLAATLARRKEHYHSKLRHAKVGNSEAKSIHDAVVAKVENLDHHLHYDAHPRAWFVDHFYAPDATLDDVSKGWKEMGDFATGAYVTEHPFGTTIAMNRRGRAGGVGVKVRKDLALAGTEIVATYQVESDAPLEAIFAVEINIAQLSPTSPDAIVMGPDPNRKGALLDKVDARGIRVTIEDRWFGLEIEVVAPRGADFWMYPVHTVSQSESGFDLSYQGTAIVPRWKIKLAPGRPWSTSFTIGARKR